MQSSVILQVGGGWGSAEGIEKVYGTKVLTMTFEELNDAYKKVDVSRARSWADRWIKDAEKIVEPTQQEIEKSGAMYLGMCELMERHKARAITINCLGGFYGGHIHAYPCLGFHELANEGLVGGCECDIRSAATMVAVTAMTKGRPGYVSDPVMDTSKRQIIYAHCVASNRAFGPKGETNPFEILTHSEDRQGASVRSLLPLGYMTTTVEFAPEWKEILFHQGKSVENVIEDRACRTKLAVEPVGDLEKLFTEWDRWGWHRVTFYGDLREQVHQICKTYRLELVEEA